MVLVGICLSSGLSKRSAMFLRPVEDTVAQLWLER